MSPRRTLANTKLPPKRTEKLHPPIVLYIMRMLVDGFHKVVCYCCWIERPGIIALLLIVPAFKMQPHTLPRLPHNIFQTPKVRMFSECKIPIIFGSLCRSHMARLVAITMRVCHWLVVLISWVLQQRLVLLPLERWIPSILLHHLV